MKLIVGLGNPGKRYAKTRHNAGFMVLEKLALELGERFPVSNWELSKKFNAEICGVTIASQKILLIKPMTFMNHSGQAVQLAAQYYHIPASDITVVHDDKDLELGDVRIQENRGDAGHNGVRSVIAHIGSKSFTRVRIGIAPADKKKMDRVSSFVLRNFSLMERRVIRASIDTAAEKLAKTAAGT